MSHLSHPALRSLPIAGTLLFSLGLAASCLAQANPDSSRPQLKTLPAAASQATPTIHAEARLVTIPVVVRDKKGGLVTNLSKADFSLQIDGQPQTIRYFDRDNDLPLTLGLLVDTSQSQRKVLDEERTASAGFLDNMVGIRPPAATAAAGSAPPTELKAVSVGKPLPDRAFIIQFAHETELLQDLTDSKPKLQAALKLIDSSPPGGGGQGSDPDDPDSNSRGGRRGARGGGGTTLYDAVFLSADELMKKEHGRKSIIILSDGDDRGSKESLASSIEAAQRADTIIYAIYFKGESGGGSPFGGGHGGGFPGGGGGRGGGYPGGGGGRGGGGGNGGGGGGGGGERVDGKKVLQRMCDETGGRLFEVKGKETVAAIYTQIAEELRSQYRLGYSPTAADAAEGYHRIDLTLPNQKKDMIQTRDGFYSGN